MRSTRDMINAIFYVQATACQWRALRKDYPPWKQVCDPFACWRQRGVRNARLALLCLRLALLCLRVRAKAGRRIQP